MIFNPHQNYNDHIQRNYMGWTCGTHVEEERYIHSFGWKTSRKETTTTTSSSSSFYWASVANAPNVLQPYRLIVLPLDVPDLTASLLL